MEKKFYVLVGQHGMRGRKPWMISIYPARKPLFTITAFANSEGAAKGMVRRILKSLSGVAPTWKYLEG